GGRLACGAFVLVAGLFRSVDGVAADVARRGRRGGEGERAGGGVGLRIGVDEAGDAAAQGGVGGAVEARGGVGDIGQGRRCDAERGGGGGGLDAGVIALVVP